MARFDGGAPAGPIPRRATSPTGASVVHAEVDRTLDLRPDPVVGPLAGARWRNYMLTGLVLPGADLRRLFVEASTLDGADLSCCQLDQAHLIDSRFTGAVFQRARMQQAVLVNVNLQDADLRHVDLSAAVLVYCDLRGARLAGAQLQDTVWSHSDLRGVDLSETSLDRARGDFFWDADTRWPVAFTP
ncbi:MAG: pentapeptide repeat-containing protein [Acidimicrobiales bacterium]